MKKGVVAACLLSAASLEINLSSVEVNSGVSLGRSLTGWPSNPGAILKAAILVFLWICASRNKTRFQFNRFASASERKGVALVASLLVHYLNTTSSSLSRTIKQRGTCTCSSVIRPRICVNESDLPIRHSVVCGMGWDSRGDPSMTVEFKRKVKCTGDVYKLYKK